MFPLFLTQTDQLSSKNVHLKITKTLGKFYAGMADLTVQTVRVPRAWPEATTIDDKMTKIGRFVKKEELTPEIMYQLDKSIKQFCRN